MAAPRPPPMPRMRFLGVLGGENRMQTVLSCSKTLKSTPLRASRSLLDRFGAILEPSMCILERVFKLRCFEKVMHRPRSASGSYTQASSRIRKLCTGQKNQPQMGKRENEGKKEKKQKKERKEKRKQDRGLYLNPLSVPRARV